MSSDRNEAFERRLRMQLNARNAADALGILDEPEPLPMRKRRRASLAEADPRLWLSLVEENGIWRLREDPRTTVLSSGARARRLQRRGKDELDDSQLIPLARLKKDQVREALAKLDKKLTPNRGLRALDLGNGTLGPAGVQPSLAKQKRILVLVHGTFSESQSFLDGFAKLPDQGKALFLAWGARYDQVFAFDHPTLTVDPVFNARELALRLAPYAGEVDVLSHSRGGLVTRWWADALDRGSANPGRLVFVGTPLAGTGLAAAPNLRKTLDLLANVSAGLGWTAAGIPFLQAAVGLFHAFSSAARFASAAPVPDVLIGLVPGLRAMSRIENNAELSALRDGHRRADLRRLFFVRSNFESESVGWRFWKLFRKPKQRLADLGADAIFDGKNDLVVDTPSMADWVGATQRVLRGNVYDFGDSATVHHTNYFEQPETSEFLAKVLG